MPNVRIEIRTDDGSYIQADARAATPEQVAAAKAICFDITNDVTQAEPPA